MRLLIFAFMAVSSAARAEVTVNPNRVPVESIAFAQTGTALAATCAGSIYVWGRSANETWDVDRAKRFEAPHVRAVDFDRRGQVVIYGDLFGTVVFRDVKTNAVLRTLKVMDADSGGGLQALKVSPCGEYVVTLTTYLAQVRKCQDGSLVHEFRDEEFGAAIGFLNDSRTSMLARRHGLLIVDYMTGAKRAVKLPSGDPPVLNTWLSEHRAVIVFHSTTSCGIWDLAKPFKHLSFNFPSTILAADHSTRDSEMAIATTDRMVSIWDIEKNTAKLELEHGQRVTSLCYSPDGRTLATGDENRTIRLWNATTGKLRVVHQFPKPRVDPQPIAPQPARTSSISPLQRTRSMISFVPQAGA